MLFGKRKSWLLLAMLAMLAVSSALELRAIDGVLDKRQSAVGTGATASQASSDSAPSSTPSSPSSTPSDNTTPSATPTPTPSSAAPSSTPTPAPASAPSSSTPEPPSSAPSSNPASTTPEPSSTPSKVTTSKIIVVTSALVATSIQQYTTVITEVSGSQTIAATVVSSRTIAQTTGFATVTNPASLNNGGGGNGSGSSGLSSSSKKIIGGVVGGVGGAVLLGGIAIVCWRIWGRKQRGLEDDDDLMGGTGSAIGEKPPSANQNTPFQANLEQYHNPGGRPNAAANF